MKKVIFVFKYDLNWLGGIYYKLHLIRALRTANRKVQIIVYTEKSNLIDVKALVQAFDVKVKCYDIQIPRGFGTVELFFRKRFDLSLIGLFDLDLIFNAGVFDYSSVGVLRAVRKRQRIYWIPDLQDIFMPELFPIGLIQRKKQRYDYIARFAHSLVFSSYDSYYRFSVLFPKVNRTNILISVLRFAVFHPNLDLESIPVVLAKYNLDLQRYFIVSNQFMAHKNHKLVIEAARLLKCSNRLNFKIVFTGKTHDPRNGSFFNELKQLINTYDLDNDIFITGIINREDQLILLKTALAVVQPSHFEGWNSTIEDAKLLKANLICSDIPVHREQLVNYPAQFVHPDSPDNLAEVLATVVQAGWTLGKPEVHYSESQERFSREVEALFI